MSGNHAAPAARSEPPRAPDGDRPDGAPAVADLRRGSRIEHADGRGWRIVGDSPRAVRVAMPDGRTPWIDRESLRRQLADEPVVIRP